MTAPTRRAFLGLAQNAVAAPVIVTAGARLIATAEAMPMPPDPRRAGEPDLVTQVQWGPPPRPGWGRPPPRRRRWVCWWHRGRRRCGWRWR